MEISDLIQTAEAALQLTIILMAGIYFIFSNTIIPALKQHANGAVVMVSINKTILNPFFMACFWGSAGFSLYLALFGSGWQTIAGMVFFAGTFLPTLFRNVPLNNKLLAAAEEDLDAVWQLYLRHWVRWNHIRTICSSLACLFLALP